MSDKDIYECQPDDSFNTATGLVAKFAEKEGRQPRILLTQMGWDDHKLRAKMVSSAFADLGFDVDISPRFQNAAGAAKQAAENDVHIIVVYDLEPEYTVIAPEIISELQKLNRDDILVMAEGPLYAADYKYLYDKGVAAIFNQSVSVSKAAGEMMQILIEVNKEKMIS
jgi:methylmalonyl-CoA mutase